MGALLSRRDLMGKTSYSLDGIFNRICSFRRLRRMECLFRVAIYPLT